MMTEALKKQIEELEIINKDLVELVGSAYETGYKDALAGENWKENSVDIGRVTFGRYQLESERTLPPRIGTDTERKNQRLIAALGLAGEVGETVDLIKKFEGHGHPVDRAKLRGEIGDILWYVAAIATYYELDLDECAIGNISKLLARYPLGFNEKASRERVL